jgi:hypothetical protein
MPLWAFLEDVKVNSGGWATSLWIKQVFGVCGGLWLIFGFCGLVLGYLYELLGFVKPPPRFFD